MPIAHLYQIVNKVTGEFYTGVHKGHQQDGYWGSGIRIKRSIKKYGKETKEKLRNANLGRKHSPEIAQKRIEKHIDKYRASIAEARKHIVVKEYTLRNPDGKIVTIKGYKELKTYGNPNLLSAVSYGKKNTYKGWSKA